MGSRSPGAMGNFEGMTAGFPSMLSTSAPIGQPQKQSSVTQNVSNEKSPRDARPLIKII